MTITQLNQVTGGETTRTRMPASGPCGCSRLTCWHQRGCKSPGVVRILRTDPATKATRPTVVLCRECAAPTNRNRVA